MGIIIQICGNSKEQCSPWGGRYHGECRLNWTLEGEGTPGSGPSISTGKEFEMMRSSDCPDWLEGRSGWLRFLLGPEGASVCVPCQEVWAQFHGNEVHLWAESTRGRTGRWWEGIINEKKYRQRGCLGYRNNLSREEGRCRDASETETTGSLSLFFLRFQRLWKHLVPQQMTLQFS